MANTFRGKAQVAGTKFTADVILYPIANDLELNQDFATDVVLDEQGDDYSKRAHNEKYVGDLGMVLVDKSASSTAANAQAGAAFLTPLATVNITACDVAGWIGAYTLETGSKISQQNTSHGKMTYKLMKYANSAQNTLMTSVPG